jgi:hypothetical protein
LAAGLLFTFWPGLVDAGEGLTGCFFFGISFDGCFFGISFDGCFTGREGDGIGLVLGISTEGTLFFAGAGVC